MEGVEQLLIDIFPKEKKYVYGVHEPYFDEWNWTSSAGKEFCAKICKEFNIKSNPEDNYYHWPIFQNCNLETLEDLSNNSVADTEIFLHQPFI